MAVRERRTTFKEWTCDGPNCDKTERVFDRKASPEGWLSAQVTDRAAGPARTVTRAFHNYTCARSWLDHLLYPDVKWAGDEAPEPETSD